MSLIQQPFLDVADALVQSVLDTPDGKDIIGPIEVERINFEDCDTQRLALLVWFQPQWDVLHPAAFWVAVVSDRQPYCYIQQPFTTDDIISTYRQLEENFATAHRDFWNCAGRIVQETMDSAISHNSQLYDGSQKIATAKIETDLFNAGLMFSFKNSCLPYLHQRFIEMGASGPAEYVNNILKKQQAGS